MRTRYHNVGFDAFSEHEILEMILYHSIARGDTNEIAHSLIERFGDFRSVIEATPDELKGVKGIGESSAMLIKLVEAAVRAYACDIIKEIPQYDTVSKIARFIWPRFAGAPNEKLYLMLFSNRMTLLDCVQIADGTVNAANVHPRQVVERALAKKAANVVLAHNHPNGVARASKNDVALTERLIDGLGLVEIPLIEHLVITQNEFWPIVKNDCGGFRERAASIANAGTTGFDYASFYDVDERGFSFKPLLEQMAHKK
jgi:DNA repair protein RadC